MIMNNTEIEAREREKDEWARLEKIARSEVCAVCGAGLVAPWDGLAIVLQCSKDATHQGHVKVDFALHDYYTVRAIMIGRGENVEHLDQEIQAYLVDKYSKGGKHMPGSTALQQYRETHVITKEQALEVIRSTPGWENAPDKVIERAAMICRDYKVYPGIHVFLIPFKLKDGGTVWAPVFGIKFTRLEASRRKPYMYLDGPRMASEQEAKAHFLDEYDYDSLYGYCKVKGLDGSMAEGWGTWPKGADVYGRDKGNSRANMVEIRAERRALDRLCPGELPGDFEVVDEQYIPQAIESASVPFPEGARVIDQTTSEIIDPHLSKEKTARAEQAQGENPMAVWDELRGLIKEVKPDEKRVTTWWQQAYKLPVSLSDFRFSDPPEKLGATMIITFRDKLKALKEEQATQQLPL